MSLRLSGYSSVDGSNIVLSVTNVPTGVVTISIWGSRRNAVPVLLDTLTPPFSSQTTTVPTVAGNVYSFVAITDTSVLSVIENIYAQIEGLDNELIDEIAEYMEIVGLGTVGVDIFKLAFPSSVNEFFVVLPTGGAPPDVAACGQEILTFTIQYRSIENRPDIGYKKLSLAKRVLHGCGDCLSSRRGIIEALQAGPVFLGMDARTKINVHTLSFQFRGPKN